MRKSITIFILLSLLYPMLLFAHQEGTGEHVVSAYRIAEEPPHIDGKLDDTVWQHAEPVRGFVQLEPARGEAATDDTEFRIAYDAHHLYVAFRCYDAEPKKVINRITRRGDVYESDVIAFFLDPHHDHRTGYKFATTPGGVQSDNYRYEDTRRDSNWKGIWWVEGTIDALGWTAEFKIPFANFRFTDKPTQTWGFDVERVNRRKSEVTVWKQLTQAGVVTRMSDLGHMVGIADIDTGKNFEISPYLLGGGSDESDAAGGQFGTGVDVQYNLTSALKANMTLNPDFAQVEADQLEINLTRFPTRFPEKRPFFVEGNSFFETPYDLVFSRRIGSRGNILWGGKLTGKVGEYSLGVLGNQTGEFGLFNETDSPLETQAESAWFSAVRLKRDILKRSNIGILVANKEQADTHSRVGGVDMNLALGKTYHLTGQYAGSFHPGEDTDNFAATVDFAQRNYLWSSLVGVEHVAPNFDINQTGFLRKERHRGWQRVYLRGSYAPKWATRDIYASLSTRLSQNLWTPAYFTDWASRNPELAISPEFDEDLLDWYVRAEVSLGFREKFFDGIQAYYYRSREVELTEVFTANGYGFFVDTNSTKPIEVGVGVTFADYFNFTRQQTGKQRQLLFALTLRPRSNFSVELDSSYAQTLDLAGTIDGRFFVSSLRGTYLFTRETFLRIFAQTGRERPFSTDVNEDYLLSLLFGWEYRPKSHFFVAYNEAWRNGALDNRVLVVKVTYLYNL